VSEIEDRRQRAFEAGLDAATGMWDGDDFRNGTEEAVKIATQVNISDDIIQAFVQMPISRFMSPAEQRARIASTLAVIGFEVVE
jgi:hypothetical protein